MSGKFINKTIVFLGDGMSDEPVPELGGKTPLQYARTPAMDSIALAGCSGTLLTLPEGFPTSSEVANMSVLGCDLAAEYCGRGPLEAVGRNLPINPDDTVFRLNLTTVRDGRLVDFSGGHPDPADADAAVAMMNRAFGSATVKFHPGVSYRALLVLSGSDFSHRIKTDKPDDNQGNRVEDHLPFAIEPAAEPTATFLRHLMKEAPAVLENADFNRRRKAANRPPVNGVWPWSGGRTGAFQTLRAKYGIRGAVISAVNVITGLGRVLGMDVISVPGATGYTDTNYEGKADAAIRTLETHDFVFLHLEATDEVSHEQDLKRKIEAIENFDSRIIGRVLSSPIGDRLNVAVLPDHAVPIALGRHTRTPVPVSVRKIGMAPDAVATFDEVACRQGSLGALQKDDLMNLLFK